MFMLVHTVRYVNKYKLDFINVLVNAEINICPDNI